MLQQILSVFGLFLSVLLIYFNLRSKPGSIYIGLFFIFLSAYNFFQYVIIYSHSVRLISIVFIHLAFTGYLIGPMIFLYTRSNISDSYVFHKKDLLHFIPVLIFFIASNEYYTFSPELKMEIAEQITQDRSSFLDLNEKYLGWFIPVEINFFSRPVIIAAYMVYAMILLFRYRQSFQNIKSNRISLLNYRWLFALLILTLTLALVQLFMMVISYYRDNLVAFYSINIFQAVSAILLIGIIILPFIFPTILYGMAPFNIPEDDLEIILKQKHKPGSPIVAEESAVSGMSEKFDGAYLKYIENTILMHMEKHHSFLDKDCNIQSMAKLINVPAHHLGYYFKEFRKQPFTDFRNQWRIEYAKDRKSVV